MTTQTKTENFFDQAIRIFSQFRDLDQKHGGLMTQAQAASILGVSRGMISKLVKEEKLKECSVDNHWYVSADDVEDYLKNHRGKAGRPTGIQLK